MFMDRFFDLKARPAFLPPKMGRAIAACILSRLRRGWFLPARKAECSAFFPDLVGLIQATEAIKLILGAGQPLIGRLLLVDAMGMKFRELKLRKNPDCVVCGTNPTVTKLIDYEEFCGLRGQEKPVSNGVPEITVEELKQRLDAKEDFVLLDVREPHEYQICNLNGVLIPLNDLPRRVHELDPSKEMVVHCRSGARSARAVGFLQHAGFKAKNLAGGILAWSDRIDPKMPKY